ncbi:MAG: B12-binding domain-containing radical SAM protein [Candidatus Helarchaeota archaeon]
MKNFDMIFIHPPRNFEYMKKNIKTRSSYMIMPMGIFGLADLLDREGYATKIINYIIERIIDPNYSIIKFLKKINVKVIGVDLHWVLHSAGSLELLRVIKKYFPSCFTILGGFTATYYAKEIMEKYNWVDGIIKGDAEEPILKLMKNLNSLDKVPNLIYRENGKIIDNKITYVIGELNSLNFSNLKLMEHWNSYLNYIYDVMHMAWPVEMARGCMYNCVNCGGCNYSSQVISKRKFYILRRPERVVDDLRNIMEMSDVKGIFYGHGVYPKTEKYFLKINELIRKEKLDIHADLEIWRMPVSKEFIKDFAKTYIIDKSLLWFSVRSFSQYYRKKYTEYFGKIDNAFNFSDKDLKNLMKLTKKYNVKLRLFWDAGNPYETGLDLFVNFLKAFKLMVENISKKSKVAMWSEPINLSPGCLVEMFSDVFGVKKHMKNLSDYVEAGKKSKMFLPPLDVSVNYSTNYLTKTGINLANKLMLLIDLISVIMD